MEREKKIIDYRFKILYAVAIIMVVAGHSDGGGMTFLMNDWFPGVHVLLFMFASGYFYSPSAEENLSGYVKKKVMTLLVPLYVYNLVYGVIVQVFRMSGFEFGMPFTLYNLLVAPITDGHQFMFNLGGWFVIPLFMAEVFHAVIRRLAGKRQIPEIVWFLGSLVLGLIGNELACRKILDGWWLVLARMLHLIPFYGLGIFYRRVLEPYERKIPSFWFFSGVFALKLILVLYCGRMPIYVPSWCKYFHDGPIIPIIVGALGIAFWMRAASILEPVIGRSKWLNLIADNTYSIMINHLMGFMIVKTGFAVFSKLGLGFADFDWKSYRTDIFWVYRIRETTQSLILYVVFAIVFSIAIQKMIDCVRGHLRKKQAVKG